MHTLLLLSGALVYALVYYIHSQITSPLRSIPGPFLARFSRLWYAAHAYHGHLERDLRALHTKHGKIVRIAPHEYSIDDPEAVNIIYGRGSQFRKSDFYAASERPSHPNLFSQRDAAQHDQDRKKYNYAYTMSAMVSYEQHVDDCIGLLEDRLSEQKGSVDMAWWLHCFAFDVIGAITFSKRFGFLDDGKDVHRLIETVHGNAFYATVFGIFNEVFNFVFQARSWLSRIGLLDASGQEFMQRFASGLLQLRQNQLKIESTHEAGTKDFLTKYLEQHLRDSDRFSTSDVMNGLGANINAGSDTTSITLTAILCHLHKNPCALARLRQEINEHEQYGNLSNPITFKEAQDMPYLQAIIKETLRIHPAVGITLPRVVPPGGAHIAGQYFPAGEVVGINPYVAHHNETVFGSDADGFRPERWMKGHTDAETLAGMERYFLAFGMGSRNCIGRNVALLEIMKCVPQLLRRFGFELRETELRTRNWLFVMPERLEMVVKEARGGQAQR